MDGEGGTAEERSGAGGITGNHPPPRPRSKVNWDMILYSSLPPRHPKDIEKCCNLVGLDIHCKGTGYNLKAQS